MRRRRLSASERHIAQGHKMRERTVGERASRQADRLRVRQIVRGRAGPAGHEPNVLRQFVVRGARSAPSAYTQQTFVSLYYNCVRKSPKLTGSRIGTISRVAHDLAG